MNHFQPQNWCEPCLDLDANDFHPAEFSMTLLDGDEMQNDPYFLCGAKLGEVVAASNETVGIIELHISKLDN